MRGELENINNQINDEMRKEMKMRYMIVTKEIAKLRKVKL